MATRKRDDSLGEGVYYATESNAGFSRRLLATAVDLLVVILLYVIIGIAYTHAWNYVPFDPFLAFAFVWGIVVLFYLTLLKSSTVRTVGYRVTDLMIVDTNGTRPSFLRMCFRLLLWGFGPFNILVDLLWLGADSEQQSLRDCYAGTCVVRNGATPIGKGPLHLAYYTAIGFTLMYPKVVRPKQASTESGSTS